MITLYGTSRIKGLPAAQESIDGQWLQAWQAHHRIGKNEQAACRSLTGLWLLSEMGVCGELAYEASGRPFLCNADMDFSVTHTQNAVFCALLSPKGGTDVRIGLDAEELSRFDPSIAASMTVRWFAPREQALWAQTPTTESFLRIWTRKEAYVKMTGEGIRALQRCDTVALEEKGEVAFGEYRCYDTLISLCVPYGTSLPDAVEWK